MASQQRIECACAAESGQIYPRQLTCKVFGSKILKVHQLSKQMPVTTEEQRFKIGSSVYARFFGDEALTVKAIAKVSAKFPHYVCSLRGEDYVIPKIHLSTRALVAEVGGGNRRQLDPFEKTALDAPAP